MLAFEIFIPLVLFFILLGLRQKKPTIPVKEGACERVVPRASTPGGRMGTLGSCSNPLGQPGAEEDADSWQGSLGVFGGGSVKEGLRTRMMGLENQRHSQPGELPWDQPSFQMP